MKDKSLSEKRKEIIEDFEKEHHWIVYRILSYVKEQDKEAVKKLLNGGIKHGKNCRCCSIIKQEINKIFGKELGE